MAWNEIADTTNKWTAKLANGSTSTGGVATVNVSMGTLDNANWDVDKAGAIVNAATSIFEKSLYRIVRSVDYRMEED